MDDPFKTVDPDNAPVDRSDTMALPERIGRYRLDRVLGEGGFGLVYLAHDEQLSRPVAIKVPRADRLAHAGAYLTEARTIARLDHPNIVPVYDVGSTALVPCFIVSKYIEGTDLSARIQQSRMPLREAVELVATVAAVLHHAHSQGLFHRDIKPNNILLDHSGRPFVADFGLALDEQDVGGKSARVVGTYAYMSPEQARGEAYRVDGRSDIFSLGIVMYELLTGRRPFRGDARELLDQIQTVDVRPLRQIDDRIPRELERICLTALAKRPADRYATAGDMADALREFLSQGPAQAQQRTAQEWTQPARTAQDRSITPDRTPVPAPEKSDAPSASAMNPPVTGAFRIALLYKRFAQPDEELLRYLEKEFKVRGHHVFVDRHMAIGVEWA